MGSLTEDISEGSGRGGFPKEDEALVPEEGEGVQDKGNSVLPVIDFIRRSVQGPQPGLSACTFWTCDVDVLTVFQNKTFAPKTVGQTHIVAFS